ncbi:MAG: hypothetical protein KAT58_12235 [candidate division Zixibacteria bacterium]|nr:hypothetical protein [candidate division Zixibacteria bacterium]
MSKSLLIALYLLVVLLQTADAAIESNRQFCARAVGSLADSLIVKLQLQPAGSIRLKSTDGDLDKLLHGQLAEGLHGQGFEVYLGEESRPNQMLQLEAAITAFNLSYQSEHQSLFSRGEIRRTCTLSATARLLSEEGRLLKTASLGDFEQSDILTYRAAKQARSGGELYSPELPASMFQRVVEPVLIVGITGVLVYLFFASR